MGRDAADSSKSSHVPAEVQKLLYKLMKEVTLPTLIKEMLGHRSF